MGYLFSIQEFSLHDGPGIRTTVFFKGCNLRCFWCHNPESWNMKEQIQFYPNKCIGCGACSDVCTLGASENQAFFSDKCTVCGKCADVCYAEAITKTGFLIASDELFERILKEKDTYKSSGGGVTFSGGEPLLQPDFLFETLALCRVNGIHTAVETAVNADIDTVRKMTDMTDMIFCDIKCINEEKHISGTGSSNKKILDNIRFISEQCPEKLKLRTPVIPGFNDNPGDISEIAEFVKGLGAGITLELLPFHGYCVNKYESLGMEFKAKNLVTPSNEKMSLLNNIAERGINSK